MYKGYGEKEVIDKETGEIFSLKFRIIGTEEEFKKRDKNFFKVFNAFTLELISDKDIAGKSIRLLFYILTKLINDINQIEFYMSPQMVCKDLKIHAQTFKKWRQILIKKGIIKKLGTNLYMLNPQCVCKGNANTLIEEYLKQTGTEG